MIGIGDTPRFGDLILAEFLGMKYHGIIMSPPPKAAPDHHVVMLCNGILTPVSRADMEILAIREGRESHANFGEIIIPPSRTRPPAWTQAKGDLEVAEHLREAYLGLVDSNPSDPDYSVRMAVTNVVMFAGRMHQMAASGGDPAAFVEEMANWTGGWGNPVPRRGT